MKLNHLGICKGVKGTRTVVDKIRSEFDAKLYKWKDEVTGSAKNRPQRTCRKRKLVFDDDASAAKVTPPAGSIFCDVYIYSLDIYSENKLT